MKKKLFEALAVYRSPSKPTVDAAAEAAGISPTIFCRFLRRLQECGK